MDARTLVKRHLANHTPGFWGWAGSTATLALMVVVLVSKLFLSGTALTSHAVEEGQRVIVHIASGEVTGNARHTRRAAKTETTTASPDSPIMSKDGLAPAPLAAISEQSDRGLVPIIGKDGLLPWKYYARPYSSTDAKKPIVAIVFTNLGLSRALTEDILTLPHNFTLSFSPYANDAKVWAQRAREEGFESLVDVPMQAENYPISDPGPYGLLEDLNATEVGARLRWALSRFPGYVGVMAPTDEKLTSNVSAIKPALIDLSGRGLLFLYLKTPKNIGVSDLSKSQSKPMYTLAADSIVDVDLTNASTNKQLDGLVALAKKQGYAIGIAHSYPTTVDTVKEWAQGLSAQGVDLVPLSAVGARVYP